MLLKEEILSPFVMSRVVRAASQHHPNAFHPRWTWVLTLRGHDQQLWFSVIFRSFPSPTGREEREHRVSLEREERQREAIGRAQVQTP